MKNLQEILTLNLGLHNLKKIIKWNKLCKLTNLNIKQ